MGERLSETVKTSVALQSGLLAGWSGLSVLRARAGLSRFPPAVAEVGNVLRYVGVKSAVPVREIFIPWSSLAPVAALFLPRRIIRD